MHVFNVPPAQKHSLELLIAIRTHERLRVVMYDGVTLQQRRRDEFLAARLAAKVLNVLVKVQVLLEPVLRDERLVAQIAPELSLSAVMQHVPLEAHEPGEPGVAYFAVMRPFQRRLGARVGYFRFGRLQR